IVTEEIPITPYEPQAPVWDVQSGTNGKVEKYTTVEVLDFVADSGDIVMEYGYTATVHTFQGAAAEMEAFLSNPVSPEDEFVLDLFAQYYLSVYGFDYGSHFLLFQEEFVDDKFTSHVKPHSYHMALARIYAVTMTLLPYRHVFLDISLTDNRLLSEEELAAYIEQERDAFLEVGLDSTQITAVRNFTADGLIIVDQQFYTKDWCYGNDFYCYEYNGQWYLKPSYMDDDMCIDFALSKIAGGEDYLASQQITGVVTAIEDDCLYLNSDMVFISSGDVSDFNQIQVGDTITVTYYEFGLGVYKQKDFTEPVNLYPYAYARKVHAST
ncbi:MAG: hypothetical protein IJX72_00475, partial [Clostridia bacterium]|nr:hypothetical protein [Clostridia bacterium]